MRIFLATIFLILSSPLLRAQDTTHKKDLKVGLVLSGGGAKGLAHRGYEYGGYGRSFVCSGLFS